MSNQQKVLVVDDDPLIANLFCEVLRISGQFNVEWTDCIQGLWEHLETGEYDVVLMDYMLPDGTGLDALSELVRQGYDLPVIMITGQGDERLVVKAMQLGASDYLVKDKESISILPTILNKAIHTRWLQLSVRRSMEQNQYQALLLNNVQDSVVVWNESGKITHLNPAAASLFGLSVSDCLGQPVEAVYFHCFEPPLTIPDLELQVGKEIVRRLNDPQGKSIWISSRIVALQDPNLKGSPFGYMDVSRDITARMQAEQALRAERNFISAILNTLGASVLVLDPRGHVILYNRVFEAFVGRPLEDGLGQPVWELFENRNYGRLIRQVVKRLQAGEKLNLDNEFLGADGAAGKVISWNSSTLLDENGQISTYVITGFDITERRQMEAQIQAAHDHLAQSTRMAAIGELTSIFAHHINNPLTTIIADAQLLLQDLDGQEECHESAAAIEEAGWRIQKALQQLIKFSTPTPENFDRVSINNTILNALDLMKDLLLSAGIDVKADFGEHLPLIHGQVHHLEDLWVNLLVMARNATYGDAAQHSIHIRTFAVNNGIQIEFYDDGDAFPVDEMDSLFEPNFLKSLGRRGNGVEMTICDEIVHRHSGSITVDSNATNGTIFRIYFPVEKQL